MENKTSLGLRAVLEGVFLGKVHAKAFKAVRHETDGKNLPTHVLIEMTADSMADVCLNDDSPMSKEEKRMLVRGAFRTLTCDIIHKHPDLLERPVDARNVQKESKSDDFEYNSKGETNAKSAD